MTGPGPFPQEMVEFWMGKAVEWDQATVPAVQLDVSLHLGRLKNFLQLVLQELQLTGSTREALKMFPFVGQLLGRLCWNPYITADEEGLGCLLRCLWSLYSVRPQGAVEEKANQWIRNILSQLSSEEEPSTEHATVRLVGSTPAEYHSQVLKNVRTVARLVTEVGGTSCSGLHSDAPGGSQCDRVSAASVSCAPLVTCSEAAPLIEALLQCPATCDRAALSSAFLQAVSTALLDKKLVLNEQAVVGLWRRSLVSLERATLNLLESALSNPQLSLQDLEQQVSDTLLPRASALHWPFFLVINDIFRSALLGTDGSPAFLTLLQTFTRCFLCALGQVDPHERPPLQVFFPHAPPSLLAPLLLLPSEVPEEAWLGHLLWISGSLQRAVEDDQGGGSRGRNSLFELWFLLTQTGDWVGVAARLLVGTGPEPLGPLLWLLTFYHHPSDVRQERTSALAVARAAWDHLRELFLTAPPPPQHLREMEDLLQPPATAHLVLRLLVHFAVFWPGPHHAAASLVHTVTAQPGLRSETKVLLASVEHRLQEPRLHPRLRTLWDILRPTCLDPVTPKPVVRKAHSSDCSGAL